jgi:hypothetical protein
MNALRRGQASENKQSAPCLTDDGQRAAGFGWFSARANKYQLAGRFEVHLQATFRMLFAARERERTCAVDDYSRERVIAV